MENIIETKKCENCGNDFPITDLDVNFYKEMKVPSPTYCPDCRQMRRLSWRNERTLYKRKCDATGKDIISVYSRDKPLTVYDNDYWYSDKWNALDYGRDFDFSRPFFEQFAELINTVPQLARSAVGNQNCDFTNQCGWCKNCYLIFEADFDENCMYSNNIYDSKSSMDMLMATKCEVCYECTDCNNCYNLKYSSDCQNCSDSWFLKGCIGCKKCFGCVNIKNKEYYFLNKKYSKEEYFKKIENLNINTAENIEKAHENFREFVKKYPHKYMQGAHNEDSTGNYLYHTQRCLTCFDVNNSQDCKYVYNCRNMKKCHDITAFGSLKTSEFSYENHELGYAVRNILFSDQVWDSCYNITYSKLCIKNCHDLFGCVGLRHAEYCIFNKKYSKEEYEILREKIIEHMKKTGEWGQFFLISMSPFDYNETVAQDYFPVTKEEALSKGYKWKDSDPKEYLKQKYQIPDNIFQVPDTIVNEILACAVCKKNYKIIPEELKFYRRQNIPIPLKCHDCRNKTRFDTRNKRHLYDRQCAKCNIPIQTTFEKERSEIIYCDKCYLESLM